MDRETAATYLTKGNQLKRAGKFKEAIATYRRAIEINPHLAWSHHNLGEALAKRGLLDEAIVSFRKAIEINPKSAWSYYELAEVFATKGELAAIPNYRRACELEPDFGGFSQGLEKALEKLCDRQNFLDRGRAFFEEAKTHFANRLWQETITSCRQAIETGVEDFECYKILAWSLKKRRQWDKAIAAYSKLIELNPTDSDAYYFWGNILKRQGKLGEAIALYRKGLEKLPGDLKLTARLKGVLAAQKQQQKQLEAQVSINPDVSQYRALAASHKSLGNLEEAITAYRKAIEIQSQVFDYCELGMLLVEKQQWEEALLCYEELLKMQACSEDEIKKYSTLEIALVKGVKLRKVIDFYHRIFQKNINNLEFYYQFSINISEAGLISEAVTFFKELPKPQFAKQLKPSQNESSNSIYDFIWDGLNQTNSENFDLDIEREQLELRTETIQNHFFQKQLKSFQIDRLHPEDLDFLENCGILLEYVKLIKLENPNLENIYINCFESSNGVVQKRTNLVKKNALKKETGDYKYQAIEFTQSLVEFRYMYAVCPLSGRVVRSNASFYLGEWCLIYRFVGEEVFYIIVDDFMASKAGLYVPKLNLLIAFGGDVKTMDKKLTNIANNIYKLKCYVVTNWKDVQNYLRNSQKSLVELYGSISNLGHFFWQDMTGIYYLYENNLLEKIDYFCGGKSQYLNLSSMFPEIPENKILNMSKMSDEEQFRFMVKNNFLCLRMTDAFIKQNLGKRIYKAAHHLCSSDFIKEVQKAKTNNNLLLWINVRTHNKVWIEQERNYAEIINNLSDEFSHLSMGVVFDGTPDASDSVKQIIERIKSKVSFYNTNLKSKLSEMIVFANYIDAYIAVVGSGLVITSWLSDKPGVAHGNRAHLGQKCFWSQVKEGGIPPRFLNYQKIKQLEKRAYSNYKVNWKIIYKKILNILKKIERQKQDGLL